MKKNLNWFCLSICLLVSTITNAVDNQTTDNSPSTVLKLGSPAAFLEQAGVSAALQEALSLNKDNHSTLSSNKSEVFTLVTNFGEEVRVVTDNFSVEVDGSLSMGGQAVGQPNSEFILQRSDNKVYGWLIFKDQDVAYEYTTENDNLVVNEIEITDVHPKCDLEYHGQSAIESGATFSAAAAASSEHLGTYPGTHVGMLESRPGSSYVILLDTRRIMSDGVPYDVSKEFIWTTWQIVAASVSMFDVNVTTNWDVYNNAAVNRRGGGTMYREKGRSSCAYAFGTSRFCTLYRDDNAYGQGRTAAHEFGHLLHLAHDGGFPGGQNGEYYNGIPDFQWVPIMGNYWPGNGWSQALYQWSKGEYSGASNREDDFSIMSRFFPFKSDDIPNTKALEVDASGRVSAANNSGQIGRNTDTDVFTFNIGAAGGHVNFTIDRIEHIGGAMLDVQAYIRDSGGNMLAQSNQSVNRSASFNQDLAAGTYTLEITGGAEGTPNWGFSKYSSLGYYAIEGNISGMGDGGDLPSISNLADGSTLSGSSQLFTWNAGNAEGFWLDAGSSPFAEDYYTSSRINGTSHTITGLPTDGSTIYVTLYYLIDKKWSQSHFTYTAASGGDGGDLPSISNLADGSTLSGSSQLFTWNAGNAEGFWLDAGSSPFAEDYYTSSRINGTSHTITGLPTDGSTIYVTLYYLIDKKWSQSHFTYTAASGGDGGDCTGIPEKLYWNQFENVTATSFTGSWYPGFSNEAFIYTLQRWVNGVWKTVTTTEQNTYIFTDMPAYSTQYVRVMASSACGDIPYGQWVQVNLGSTL